MHSTLSIKVDSNGGTAAEKLVNSELVANRQRGTHADGELVAAWKSFQ
jgi:hypothetical protein